MKRTGFLVLLAAAALAARAEDVAGREIAPWQPGTLDIHQISTGRGNAALYILPDGTTLLVDAGEQARKTPRHTPDRPDGTRPAGEWIVRYLRHALRHAPQPALDYALLTHFHGDHMGVVAEETPASPTGAYRLTGLTRAGESLRIGKLLDRGWPDYSYPSPLEDSATRNYRAFAKWQAEHKGLKVERFTPGRNDQVVLLRAPEKYRNFEFRNIGANGEIWTGVGTNTRHHFPALETIARADWPSENMCSTSFRLSYGPFDYFNGGDIPGIPAEGSPDWHDVETPVAKAVGPVEAAILNHHGYIDSQNAFLVATLRPRVWFLSVWDSGHPTGRVWQRLQSTRLYPGPREVFATDLHSATRVVVNGIEKLASDRGHIVLRVSPGGGEFRVVIVDDSSESRRVTKVFGPYPSR
ncbi:MAG: MBL fold metallo-hydrolase [Acidobacteria bacterium]|nr:MBL fold metallo-hydrolase [Acidobacteriota bacterium]